MDETSLIIRAKRLIKRLDNMRIVGSGWSGNARTGFQFISIGTGTGAEPETTGGGPPPPETGACCIDGNCSIASQVGCLLSGGDYQGDGTTCDPNPCPTTPSGACCVGSDCSIQTESNCSDMGGVYQGDDTTCDPNPCERTGACCHDDVCDIETEADCAGSGGVYHGDDTVCDPNPCVAPCCEGCYFLSEDGSGRRFKTLHAEWSGHADYGSFTIDFSGTTDGSYNGCDLTCSCSGSASSSNGGSGTFSGCGLGLNDSFCDVVNDLVTGSCQYTDNGGGAPPCQHYPTTCPPPVITPSGAAFYTKVYDCSNSGNTYHAEVEVTLSDECDVNC